MLWNKYKCSSNFNVNTLHEKNRYFSLFLPPPSFAAEKSAIFEDFTIFEGASLNISM